MGCMFEFCTSLESLDLSSFDMSSVTYMDNMFAGTKWEDDPSAILPQ